MSDGDGRPIECVLRVGTEGGTIELEHDVRRGAFRTRVVDLNAQPFGRTVVPSVREGPWLEWDPALEELEATAWRALYPLQVAPAFRARIWSRLHRPNARVQVRHLERWRRLCAEDAEVESP